ncbi:MAG: branched-chain amino acid ABC transporter permease [Firmicutes bacterium]|nr:branched-chain amino acid ABC transporter permease [Bacillota bacterium]
MFLQQLINGVSLGSVYALTAVGYSLVFSVVGLINMSHAAIYMSGAVCFSMFYNLGGRNVPLLVVFLIALVYAAVAGLTIERLAIRPIREKGDGMIYAILSSIAVKTIIESVCQIVYGTEIRAFPTILAGRYVEVFGARMMAIQFVMLAVTIVIMLALGYFTLKSKMGMGLRSTAQNLRAANLVGVPVNRIVALAFAIGSVLATVAGIFSCMYYQTVQVNIGGVIGQKAFAATVLGGIGSLTGSVVGGFIIGIAEMLTAGYISSSYRNLVAFSILIIVLIFKPSGIFGQAESKKV